MDRVVITKGIPYYKEDNGSKTITPWYWKLSNRSKRELINSSKEFTSFNSCIKNLERVTGGHFIILMTNDNGVSGVLQR